MPAAIRDEILNAVRGRFADGESFKIRHETKLDGDVCTPTYKDPAMTVTRQKHKWIFYCHRCGASGKILDDKLSPTDTLNKMKVAPNKSKKVDRIELPKDFIKLQYDAEEKNAPDVAFAWLWRYGIDSAQWFKYDFGWSDHYQRVIMPLYEYAQFGSYTGRKLVGWVGRDPIERSKEVRKKKKIPKYLTYSLAGERRYFTCPGNEDIWIICEDILSAIKVNIATGFSTIALLNATINDDLIRLLKGKRVYVWLDPNMRSESIKFVTRMNQFGVNASHKTSNLDPKEHIPMYITSLFKEDHAKEKDK